MGLILFLCLMGWKTNPEERHITRATLATMSGPFTGAIARPDDSSSWKAAWSLLPFCGAFLVIGTLCQIVPLPRHTGARTARILAWFIGLAGWFCGSVISLMNAIE